MTKVLILTFAKKCEGEPYKKADLASFLHLQPSSLSTMMTKMESAGLIRQSRFDGDRRMFILDLTEQGYELFK